MVIELLTWYHDSECVDARLIDGGITMPMRAPSVPCRDPALSAVHGGVAYWSDIERRLAPYLSVLSLANGR